MGIHCNVKRPAAAPVMSSDKKNLESLTSNLTNRPNPLSFSPVRDSDPVVYLVNHLQLSQVEPARVGTTPPLFAVKQLYISS